MPTIRDARGQLHVHDMTPRLEVSGPAPVERSRVSEQRMADFAAERAQTAERTRADAVAAGRMSAERRRSTAAEEAVSRRRGAEVMHERAVARKAAQQPEEPAMPSPDRHGHRAPTTKNAALTARQEQVIEAIRRTGSRHGAMAELGITHMQSIDTTLMDAHAKGLLASNVPDLPPRIARAFGLEVTPRKGLRRAPTPTIEPQDQEAGDPATDASGAPAEPPFTTPPGPHVTLLLPCEDCLHAPVCRIRPILELWQVEAGPPLDTPNPAIAVEAVSLGCEHHLAAAS